MQVNTQGTTQLSATDASFIYAETRDTPMSIASIQILELPQGTSAELFIASLKQYIGARIDLVPYLRSKLQWTQGLVGHPNWMRDEHFDIDHHIYQVEVPAPGGQRQFEQTIARLHETRLDLNRPLWDMAVLTGLQGGRIAYYNRIHHACADGMSSQACVQTLMDNAEQPDQKPPLLPPHNKRPLSWQEHCLNLASGMLIDGIDALTRAPGRARAGASLWRELASTEARAARATEAAPHTRLNRGIDQRRDYAVAEIPLLELKAIAKNAQCTINEAFLSICGGALRDYLAMHGELPTRTLHAGCPVSLRKPGDASPNNQVGMMRVSLATDEPDPVQRLLTVSAASREAKRLMGYVSELTPADTHLPGMGAAIRTGSMASALTGMADRAAPPFNVLISNVTGPAHKLTSNGARVLSHYPVSIPTHGLGVNITVQSYAGTLYIGITTAAAVVPDADRLRDALMNAYTGLRSAVTAQVVALKSPEPGLRSTPIMSESSANAIIPPQVA